MLAFFVVVLFLVAFIAPVISLIFIIDKKRSGLKLFLVGVITYVIAEACIKLPLLNLFGFAETESILYMLILCASGALLVETIRYFVVRFNVKRNTFNLEGLAMFAMGFTGAYVFLIWGIDSVGTAAVVLLDDFKMIEPTEILNELFKIVELIPIQFGIILLCANAVKFKQILYFFAAVFLRVLTDLDIVFYVFEYLGLGSGTGILYLAVICVIIIMLIRKQIVFWKGNNDEEVYE